MEDKQRSIMEHVINLTNQKNTDREDTLLKALPKKAAQAAKGAELGRRNETYKKLVRQSCLRRKRNSGSLAGKKRTEKLGSTYQE